MDVEPGYSIDAAPKREFRTQDASRSFIIASKQLAGHLCVTAESPGGEHASGLLVVLDGTRQMRRIGRMVEKGEVDPAGLPRMVGVDPEDVLHDYTPWWHPAFKKGANDFGGGADDFLDGVVLPIVEEARGDEDGRVVLMGYSLAGLFCLQALMRTDRFDGYLVASPSTWYPGFVNKLERSALGTRAARVVIACGRDEGKDHPEPIRGLRQDTDRTMQALAGKLTDPPKLILDDFDHHKGSSKRIMTLLAHV